MADWVPESELEERLQYLIQRLESLEGVGARGREEALVLYGGAKALSEVLGDPNEQTDKYLSVLLELVGGQT